MPDVSLAICGSRSKRRLVFKLVLVLVVYLVVELIAIAAISVAELNLNVAKLWLRQSDIAGGGGVSDGAGEVIHPYLGWIHNPQIALTEKYAGRDIPVNSLGFRDESQSLYKRSDDVFILGIAGGSVAFQFSWAAEELLKERLSAHPLVHGRRIQIVRLALSGYKQPQQLMAYNYLLSLGAEFDLILNIDGFNESALAILENANMNTSIAYPRAWHARSIAIVDPRDSADAARLLFLRGKRQQMAKSMLSSAFRWSPTMNLVWYVRDQSTFAELTDLGLSVSKNRRSGFLHHGPQNRPDGPELEEDVASLWMRCSLQMSRLCRGNTTLYLHVLQPNQYVPDSKPILGEELEKCFDPKGETMEVVKLMYPKLQAKGQQLTQEGVAFSDQTMVFSTVEEQLYVDPWCHFNEEGHQILGEAIANRLVSLLDEAQALTPER